MQEGREDGGRVRQEWRDVEAKEGLKDGKRGSGVAEGEG